jgi:transcriptional regulator with PAS, ATPase and Fis domain
MIVDWARALPAAVTVCDKDGVILEMNEESARVFAADGGASLVGQSLYACHGAESADQIRELLRTERTNVYTIEKAGIRKMIYQAPWYENGRLGGLVEIAFPLPPTVPHLVRD